jgi:hypothetical protein
MRTPRLPDPIVAALEETGRVWRIETGSRHLKIFVGEKLAGILPRDGKPGGDRRAMLNVVSQIRRAGRDITSR